MFYFFSNVLLHLCCSQTQNANERLSSQNTLQQFSKTCWIHISWTYVLLSNQDMHNTTQTGSVNMNDNYYRIIITSPKVLYTEMSVSG